MIEDHKWLERSFSVSFSVVYLLSSIKCNLFLLAPKNPKALVASLLLFWLPDEKLIFLTHISLRPFFSPSSKNIPVFDKRQFIGFQSPTSIIVFWLCFHGEFWLCLSNKAFMNAYWFHVSWRIVVSLIEPLSSVSRRKVDKSSRKLSLWLNWRN